MAAEGGEPGAIEHGAKSRATWGGCAFARTTEGSAEADESRGHQAVARAHGDEREAHRAEDIEGDVSFTHGDGKRKAEGHQVRVGDDAGRKREGEPDEEGEDHSGPQRAAPRERRRMAHGAEALEERRRDAHEGALVGRHQGAIFKSGRLLVVAFFVHPCDSIRAEA